ncbi:MarR family winged helix-turn-helix transcriptional regulator [Zavarzinia sp.]|uniref:MarR family winged helix-turn-helix transcriptional regulator n=1 Tax=Zavarzinia sp. TaxID=2027920 RepID=UPI003563146A
MQGETDRRAILLARAVVVLFRDFELVAREFDLTVPQYRFLLFLKRGPRRAGELALEAAIGKPTASALIVEMERRGLITREADPADGRSIQLRLTELGLARHAAFEAALAGRLTDLIGPADIEAILEAGVTLAYRLDARRDQASLEAVGDLIA